MATKKKITEDKATKEAKATCIPPNFDPWQIRINAPRPPKELEHLLGPNDICDPDGLGYQEFNWLVDEPHIQGYFLRGAGEAKNLARTVTPDGDIYTIINGRHWLVAARCAAKRRKDQGLPELRVEGVVDHYNKDLACLQAFVTNKKYDETPAQKGRNVRTHMRQTGVKDIPALASIYGVSPQTINNWLRAADDDDRGVKKEAKERASKGMGKVGLDKTFNALKKVPVGSKEYDEAQGYMAFILYIQGDRKEFNDLPDVVKKAFLSWNQSADL